MLATSLMSLTPILSADKTKLMATIAFDFIIRLLWVGLSKFFTFRTKTPLNKVISVTIVAAASMFFQVTFFTNFLFAGITFKLSWINNAFTILG